jgi:hypothetical protein
MSALPFTDRVRKVIALAYRRAEQRHDAIVDNGHLLLGLIEEGHGVAVHVLESLGVDLVEIARKTEDHLFTATSGRFPDIELRSRPKFDHIVQQSYKEAQRLNSKYVGTEHLLLAMLSDHSGIAARALKNSGLTYKTARAEISRILGPPDVSVRHPRPLPPHISMGPLGRAVLGLCALLCAIVFGALAVLVAVALARGAQAIVLWRIVVMHVFMDLFAIASIFMLLLWLSFWLGGSRWIDATLNKIMPKALVAIVVFLVMVFLIVGFNIPEAVISGAVAGSAFSIVGLGLFLWRRHKRRLHIEKVDQGCAEDRAI